MTLPSFLDLPFRWTSTTFDQTHAGLMAALRDELTVQSDPAWTEPVTDTFRSPPDGSGRFFEIAFGDNGAKEFAIITTYQGQASGTRQFQKNNPNLIIASSQYHLYIETGVPTYMLGGLLSPDPNQFLSYENDGFFKSTQSVIGFPDGVTDTNGIVVPDSFGDWTDQPVGIVYFASDQSGVGNDAVPKSTLGGRRLWYPYLIHGFNPGASVFRVSGRPYHMLAVDHTLAAGTEISIPFQDGENLTFRVMNIPISSTPQRVALAVRRS